MLITFTSYNMLSYEITRRAGEKVTDTTKGTGTYWRVQTHIDATILITVHAEMRIITAHL